MRSQAELDFLGQLRNGRRGRRVSAAGEGQAETSFGVPHPWRVTSKAEWGPALTQLLGCMEMPPVQAALRVSAGISGRHGAER